MDLNGSTFTAVTTSAPRRRVVAVRGEHVAEPEAQLAAPRALQRLVDVGIGAACVLQMRHERGARAPRERVEQQVRPPEKRSWPEQDQLHSAGMGMVHYIQGGEEVDGKMTPAGEMTATDLASLLGVSHVPEMSQEAEGLFEMNIQMDIAVAQPGHDVPWDTGT